MPIITEIVTLPSLAPGSQHQILKHRFTGGSGERSAYVQAGLHADEHPGLLVVQHLLQRLQTLEQEQRILGDIVICPFANPVGLGQNVFGYVTGRFNLANGENFNRNFPDATQTLSQIVSPSIGQRTDTAELKHLLAQSLISLESQECVASNKRALLQEAFKHDLVLDLHCDTAAVMHLYCINDQHKRALELAACMNIGAVFLEDEAGGQPFDEAYNKPWKILVEQGLATPEQRGFAASIELRGQADVDDELAREDAEGILRFLAREGLLALEVPEPDVRLVQVYPLEGASHLQANGNGLLVWKKSLGEAVCRGELIAEIVPLDAPLGTPRIPVNSDVDGVVIVQPLFKLVRAGQRVALLASKTPLPHRQPGKLLQHF
jgi:predicted deacylase